MLCDSVRLFLTFSNFARLLSTSLDCSQEGVQTLSTFTLDKNLEKSSEQSRAFDRGLKGTVLHKDADGILSKIYFSGLTHDETKIVKNCFEKKFNHSQQARTILDVLPNSEELRFHTTSTVWRSKAVH